MSIKSIRAELVPITCERKPTSKRVLLVTGIAQMPNLGVRVPNGFQQSTVEFVAMTIEHPVKKPSLMADWIQFQRGVQLQQVREVIKFKQITMIIISISQLGMQIHHSQKIPTIRQNKNQCIYNTKKESGIIQEFYFEIKQQNYQMQGNPIENITPLKQPSNPEFVTPPSAKQTSPATHPDLDLMYEVRQLLQQDKPLEALNILPASSFVKELVADHIEISKIHKILMTDAGTVEYDNIKLCSGVLGVDREARLSGLYHLKRGKCLNNTLVNNVSNHLRDIILEQFEPLTSFRSSPSHIFIQLYEKLNQIQHKFDLLKCNSAQMPAYIQQRAQQVLKENRQLQQKLNKVQHIAGKYQHQASKVIGQNNQLKESIKNLRTEQHRHKVTQVDMQKQFNNQLKQKEEQYKLELIELKNRSNIPPKIKMMEKELDNTIEDFKNLIYKLSFENKLLKEERDLLLAQLARVYEKFQVFVVYFQSASSTTLEIVPPSIDDENEDQPNHSYQNSIINEMKAKLQQFQNEIKNKNEVIANIREQIQDLRKEKSHNSALDKSISVHSGESNQQKKNDRRYKRTKSREEADNKITQLQELRKKDQQLIESLQQAVQQLNQKMKVHFNSSQSTEIKNKAQSQQTSNTLASLVQQGPIKTEQTTNAVQSKTKNHESEKTAKNIQKMAEKIRILEINLQEERQTNASLNAIMQDLHSFEKPNEQSVLTPRMLTEIAQLKDKITELENKCILLDNQLKKVKGQKDEMIKTYQEQVMNLEFQCSEAQLSISTLENKIYDLQVDLSKKSKEKVVKEQEKSEPMVLSIIQEKQQIQQELRLKNQEIEALLLAEQQHKKQLEDVSSKLKSTQMMLNFTKNKNKDFEKKYKSIVTAKDFREKFPNQIQHALFFGDILEEKPFQKQFLIDILQKRAGKSLRKTKMLWKYDPLNKINLHQYIDNMENFVVLVELQNDYVVGGYSQGRLYPKMTSDRDGILFSLTKKETFEPVDPNKRVIVYDDYYLIFGNSELRLKSQENKLFSNFSINAGYFKARGMKVDVITNSTEREVTFKSVEVHQVQFL